jgi:hypothetical protein
MRRALPLIAVVILIASVIAFSFLSQNPERGNALRAREIAMQRLAQYLAETFPNSHVLVISNPFIHKQGLPGEIREMEEAGISGLKKGFGTKGTLHIGFPDLKPEAQADPQAVQIDPETPTPLSYLVAEDAFDKLAAEHPNCEIIVSLIGVPVSLDRVRAWQPDEKVRFGLLLPDLRIIGDAAAIQKAVKSGKLAAFVLNKPGAPDSRARLSGDLQTDFDQRFLLITSASIDEALQKYPQLFPGN